MGPQTYPSIGTYQPRNRSLQTRSVSGGRLTFVAAIAAVIVGVFAPSAFALPSVTITGTPPASTSATDATFSWTIGGTAASSRCRLQTPSAVGAYDSCTSPKTYAGLAPGSYTFHVRAYDAFGWWYAAASYSWTVTSSGSGGGGTPAPTVSLTATPASSTTSTSASFSWTTTGSPTSTTCSLDGAAATACSSPRSYSGLAVGSHSFRVTVSNSAGSASASYSWSITSSSGGGTTANCTPGSDWGTRRTDYEQRVLDLVNAHRAKLGLRQLSISSTLAASAQWKALHMARYGYMSHDDPAPPVARTTSQRMKDCGFTGRGWGENIAYGYRTPEDVMNGWLNSPGHRANLENASWTLIGVGAASYNGGYMYWAQAFGY